MFIAASFVISKSFHGPVLTKSYGDSLTGTVENLEPNSEQNCPSKTAGPTPLIFLFLSPPLSTILNCPHPSFLFSLQHNDNTTNGWPLDAGLKRKTKRTRKITQWNRKLLGKQSHKVAYEPWFYFPHCLCVHLILTIIPKTENWANGQTSTQVPDWPLSGRRQDHWKSFDGLTNTRNSGAREHRRQTRTCGLNLTRTTAQTHWMSLRKLWDNN